MKITIYDENKKELASKEVDENFDYVDFEPFERKHVVTYFRKGDGEIDVVSPPALAGPGVVFRLTTQVTQIRVVNRLEDRVDLIDSRLERLERRLEKM